MAFTGSPARAAGDDLLRIEGDRGWTITHVYGLTETALFITVCEPRPEHANLGVPDRAIIKARQGVELITSGDLRVVDDRGQQVGKVQKHVSARQARGDLEAVTPEGSIAS